MTQASEQEATPPWDAAQVNLKSQELAPGVFAVMPDNVFTKDHVATTAGQTGNALDSNPAPVGKKLKADEIRVARKGRRARIG